MRFVPCSRTARCDMRSSLTAKVLLTRVGRAAQWHVSGNRWLNTLPMPPYQSGGSPLPDDQ